MRTPENRGFIQRVKDNLYYALLYHRSLSWKAEQAREILRGNVSDSQIQKVRDKDAITIARRFNLQPDLARISANLITRKNIVKSLQDRAHDTIRRLGLACEWTPPSTSF